MDRKERKNNQESKKRVYLKRSIRLFRFLGAFFIFGSIIFTLFAFVNIWIFGGVIFFDFNRWFVGFEITVILIGLVCFLIDFKKRYWDEEWLY